MYQHAAVLVLQAAVPSVHAFITKCDMEQAVFQKAQYSWYSVLEKSNERE